MALDLQQTQGQVFGPSGANHAPGLVPDPGSSAGVINFLREDGTWQRAEGVAGKTSFVWVDRNNVNQTGIANNVSTKLALNHKNADPDGVFDAVTNFRYQPNVAGTFLICGAVTMVPSSTTFEMGVNIFKNGSSLFISLDMAFNTALNMASLSAPFAALVQMNGTTDFIEMFVFMSNSGGAANLVAGQVADTFFTAQRVGP